MKKYEVKIKKIQEKFNTSKNVLIIISRPIDYDCLGTALVIKYYLSKLKKEKIDIYAFSEIPLEFHNYNGIKEVDQRYVDQVDWQGYDLIILVDGNSWHQFFTSKWKKVKTQIGVDCFVHFDHHEEHKIAEDLGHYSITDPGKTCTAEVFYRYFIEPQNININKKAANWIYKALIGDTQAFRVNIKPDTLSLANDLILKGADHVAAVDSRKSINQFMFLKWAIEHTIFLPKIKSTILLIDDKANSELSGSFGDNWQVENVPSVYVEEFMRRIDGYDYGLLFIDVVAGGVKVAWRTRDFGKTLMVKEVLEAIGFTAGGHPNAGGGYNPKAKINEVKEVFEKEMLTKLQEYNLI